MTRLPERCRKRRGPDPGGLTVPINRYPDTMSVTGLAPSDKLISTQFGYYWFI